jgi:hypothetical protein
MKRAADYLSKFRELTPPEELLRKEIARAVHALARVPITKKNVVLAHGIAFVECSSVAKNAIRMRRGEILEEVFQAFPKARGTLRDIR